MSREIKFRVWDGEKMVSLSKAFRRGLVVVQFNRNEAFEIEPEYENVRLMQYTGLNDQNDVEIYEGDLIKQYYYLDISPHDLGEFVEGHHVGEVIITASKGVCLRNPLNIDHGSGESSVSNQYKNVAGYRAKVIGNIHDNPELLGAIHDNPELLEVTDNA